MTAEPDLSALVRAEGPSTLAYQDLAFPERPLFLHAACPPGWHNGMPILFVHHGLARNGGDYRDWWLQFAHGMLVIAIEFPAASFPDYLCYNFGNLHAADGTANPRERWTYGIGPRLYERLRRQNITTAGHYGLFGHSAGGQYVHRMLSFGYREHVAIAITANAGTYAMPDLAEPWPWGLGGVPLGQQPLRPTGQAAVAEELRRLLRFPITILAGTEDTRTTGRHFPGGPRSMQQGPHRYARAHAYHRAGQAAAASLGVTCAWRLIDVAGVGHDGRGMSAAAAPLVMQALLRGNCKGY